MFGCVNLWRKKQFLEWGHLRTKTLPSPCYCVLDRRKWDKYKPDAHGKDVYRLFRSHIVRYACRIRGNQIQALRSRKTSLCIFIVKTKTYYFIRISQNHRLHRYAWNKGTYRTECKQIKKVMIPGDIFPAPSFTLNNYNSIPYIFIFHNFTILTNLGAKELCWSDLSHPWPNEDK